MPTAIISSTNEVAGHDVDRPSVNSQQSVIEQVDVVVSEYGTKDKAEDRGEDADAHHHFSHSCPSIARQKMPRITTMPWPASPNMIPNNKE